MNKIQVALIKNECIKFACSEELKISELTNDRFMAENSELIIDLHISHLQDQSAQGHSYQETLANELCLKSN